LNVRRNFLLPAALSLALAPVQASAQGWDPVKSATGWASFDRDGSCVFQQMPDRKLVTWTQDSGIMNELDLSRFTGAAEKWVLDPLGNAWVVAGTTLQLVDRNGKLGTSFTLPAEIADLAWDTRSFILCYRTREPYLERRDMKTGSVMWSYGTKPAKGTFFPRNWHHVAVREDGSVLLTASDGFQLERIDLAKGARLEFIPFTLNGQPAPTLNLADGDQGSLAWWMNNETALLAVPASQLPPGDLKGLVLARLNLAKREMTLVPTGADEKAVLVGIQESNAVLRGPAGGLTFFPIP